MSNFNLLTYPCDWNGLRLNRNNTTGYLYVSCRFDGPLVDKFIAYANIPPHLRDLRKTVRDPIDFFGSMPNVFGIGVFDDVRDAAYVSQEFYKNLEENFLHYMETGELPHFNIPIWEHPVDTRAMTILENSRNAFHANKDAKSKKTKRKTNGDLRSYLTNACITMNVPFPHVKVATIIMDEFTNRVMNDSTNTIEQHAKLLLSELYNIQDSNRV